MGKLGNHLLGFMLITVTVVGCLVIITAFLNLLYTNAKLGIILIKIEEHFQKNSVESDEKLTPLAESYLERLGAGSKGMLSSNVIAFLFQIFSIGLISAGIYILSKSQENVERAIMKVQLTGPFIARNAAITEIDGYIHIAYHNVWLMGAIMDNRTRNSLIPLMRQSTHDLFRVLQKAREKGIGIEESHHKFLRDQVTHVYTMLKDLDEFDGKDEILLTAEKCKRAIDHTGFVQKYESDLEKLIDRN